ncbi:MAG: DUF2953 domain-containing protein [Peptococcaceae bacterium]|nr:DUF2953 domain-containing protein [Peptococcaceae bacterium]
MEFIIIAGLVATAVFLAMRAEVEFKYERKGEDDRVTLRLLGPFGVVFHRTEMSVLELSPTLKSWRLEVNVKTKEELGKKPMPENRMEVDTFDQQELLSLARTLHGLYQDYRPVINYTLERTLLRAFTWQTTIGSGDAAWTALLAGGIWCLKGTLLGMLQSRQKIAGKDMVLAVFPSFKERKFQTFLQCILSVRVVHIIGAAYVLWREKRKRKKGGYSDGQSSNSRSDENSHGEHPRHGRRKHHCG